MSAANVCGVVLHVRPERIEPVLSAITAMAGVELGAVAADGRMVAVVEDVAGQRADDTLDRLRGIEGVLSVALAYHQLDFDDQTGGTLP